jgi:hypothetical protein
MTTHTTNPIASRTLLPTRLLNLVALITVLIINGLATSGRIAGTDTGELSDAWPSLFTPAGYVFSIWGVIYSLLIVFAVYQLLPGQRTNPRLERLGLLFVLSSLFNISWIFAWHYQLIALSWLLMLGILGTLILIYQRLEIGTAALRRSEKIALQLPFSVYLGWITVATVANTAIMLLDLGVTGGQLAPLLTVAVIAAAAVIGYLVLRRRADIAFGLVLVWAFTGIAAKQGGAEPLVTAGALVAAIFIALVIFQSLRKRPLNTATAATS